MWWFSTTRAGSVSFWDFPIVDISVFQLTGAHLQATVLVSMQVHDFAFYDRFCSLSKGPVISVICGYFSDYLAVQFFEASIQKGIANNFCLCVLLLGPWSLFPFSTKFSFLSFTALGLGLHQDVLIRNFLSEDLFFKCGERLVKGWCSLAVDTQSSLFVLRFWNFYLSSGNFLT